MRKIKKFDEMFENFADETLNKINTDPNEPLVRDDLVGKPAPHRSALDLNVEYAIEFVPSGTFQAFYKAEDYLKELGYSTGSMEGGSPIGFADEKKFEHVSKWNNMDRSEHNLLDGIMISSDFREGEVVVLWFKSPKF